MTGRTTVPQNSDVLLAGVTTWTVVRKLLHGVGITSIHDVSQSYGSVGRRLCLDATRRFKDIGRLINHSATEYNLKPGRPTYLRGKWRVGMIAVRDIIQLTKS